MAYEIEVKVNREYLHSYFYQSKNDCGQIIRCEFGQCKKDKLDFDFSFCIKPKRKLGFPEGQITGRDGLKSLIWAYHCLLDCIAYLKWRHPNSTLYIYGDTKRKWQIYKRYLLPLGFQIAQNKHKEFVLKI